MITALSIVIPLAVAALFGIKLPNVAPLHFLPPIYATINGITAVILVWAVVSIKKGNRLLHERLIKLAMLCSILFLLMYIGYHMTSDSTKFGGEGVVKYIYYFILVTHIILSIAVIPFVLLTYVRAQLGKFEAHKKIAKITFPLWLYVAVTGVVVYVMISPYYG
ncbi:hypothetical protein B9C57_00225 [Tenacibaculum maritimum]|nr:DUF420 domain-containing protein [Tenacibaculum maritimum]QCD61077.1 hypothetical protein B9C57_00225 [Tenacibaculum maritimum]